MANIGQTVSCTTLTPTPAPTHYPISLPPTPKHQQTTQPARPVADAPRVYSPALAKWLQLPWHDSQSYESPGAATGKDGEESVAD